MWTAKDPIRMPQGNIPLGAIQFWVHCGVSLSLYAGKGKYCIWSINKWKFILQNKFSWIANGLIWMSQWGGLLHAWITDMRSRSYARARFWKEPFHIHLNGGRAKSSNEAVDSQRWPGRCNATCPMAKKDACCLACRGSPTYQPLSNLLLSSWQVRRGSVRFLNREFENRFLACNLKWVVNLWLSTNVSINVLGSFIARKKWVPF